MKKYKFSIITPTHKNSIFLLELYQSIKRQSYSNWEWILYLNGDFKGKLIDKEILADKRVFIFDTNKSFKNIGEIKYNAFNLATGDILVEVDHDDMIHCDCLAELNKSYQNDDVGFVYSDSLLYDLQGKMKPWDKSLGWKYSMEEYNKKSFIRHLGFRPTSRSLAFIWYAPDHVRSWRKSVYDAIGGHNKSLEVCDDHELLIRTYLYTNFHHIKKCLYYYRILPDMTNTQFLRNELIQKKTYELFLQYAQSLAEREADINNKLKIDLGGGINPLNGYKTIDLLDADINCDLNDGIPLEDDSVGVINASHIIEHLRDPLKTMREIYRVLCDGGWAFIEVPSTDGRGAWQDPTHVSYWNQNSFWYYTRESYAKYIRNTEIRFQEYRLDTSFWEDNIAVTNAWLCAIKSKKRRPHKINI
jgi:glycosyltransferase involved in cell wall biosynthesis